MLTLEYIKKLEARVSVLESDVSRLAELLKEQSEINTKLIELISKEG